MAENRRSGWASTVLVAALVALGVIAVAGSLAEVQAQAPKAKAAAKNAAKPKGKNGVAAKKGDPLAAPLQKDQDALQPAAAGTYHFRVRLHSFDETTMVTSYYPAKLDIASPVVMLIHDRDRSSKDFEDPIDELSRKGLAESLQGLGYAVLSFDLPGHGANVRRPINNRDWVEMIDDLQAAYQFLVDRHNRGELNVAKLGVIALGEGADLAAAWAYLPGGAVSHEGRASDLSALALISPVPVIAKAYPNGEDLKFATLMNALAPRVPILLMAGERDTVSHDAVKQVRANVERPRGNQVELFPSSLHGHKLLKLEPRATSVLTKFLERAVKNKSLEWEPRYVLNPVLYTDIEVIRHVKPLDKGNEKEPEKEKADKPKAEAPKAKAKAEAK